MHYYAYEFSHAVLSPLRVGMQGMRAALDWPFNPLRMTPFGRHLAAACEVFENVTRRYGKPEFGIKSTRIDNVDVPVRERVVTSTPFGRLLHFERSQSARAPPLRPEGADRRADVGPLRDAAARHRQGDAAGARGLHHRLDRRARHPARHGPLRPRRFHRSRHRLHSGDRTRHARDRRVPAGGARARRGRAHGDDRRSLPAGLHDADGRPHRYAPQPDSRQPAGGGTLGDLVRAERGLAPCRSRTPASCAPSIRASCSSPDS